MITMPKSIHTYESIKSFIESINYKLISPKTQYKNVGSTLTVECDKGHQYTTRWSNIYSKGGRCKTCQKKSNVDIEDAFNKEGYKLLGFENGVYKNQYTRIDYICSNGHKHITTWNTFRKGSRCPECVKESYKNIVEAFSSDGYKVLTPEEDYINHEVKFKFVCPNGHTDSMTWNNFKYGYRCGQCAFNKKKSIEYVRKCFEDRGYTLLTKVYINENQYLDFICPNGHNSCITFNNFKNLQQDCGFCSPTKVKNIEFIREMFKSCGYRLISTDYINDMTKLSFECDKGHINYITWNDLRAGRRCSKCNANTSLQEIDLRNSISLLAPDLKISPNDRSIIPPYELDIYFPDKNVAVEYCGLYWHSEKSGGKDRYYHRNKYNLSLSKGIRLITVFEDEWLNHKDVVLSRILSALGLNKRLFARKLKCLEIDNKVANIFYEKYHLQGRTNSIKSWGLFEGDLLVSCLSVGRLSRYHASKKGKYLELKRMASIPFVNVVGGFSRLFSVAKKYLQQTGFEGIKSYCDNRYANPLKPVYEQLGFTLVGETKYTPHYVLGDKRVRNQALSIRKVERGYKKSEWELRSEQGYDRIWDVGHKTYYLALKGTD